MKKLLFILVTVSLPTIAENYRWDCMYKGQTLGSFDSEQDCLSSCIEGDCKPVAAERQTSLHTQDFPVKEKTEKGLDTYEQAKKRALEPGLKEHGRISREEIAKVI